MLGNLEFAIDKITDIYMNTLVFIFKIKHNKAPDYLIEKLQHTCSGMLMIFVCHDTTGHTHYTIYGMLDSTEEHNL
jgi:hypothetical protein